MARATPVLSLAPRHGLPDLCHFSRGFGGAGNEARRYPRFTATIGPIEYLNEETSVLYQKNSLSAANIHRTFPALPRRLAACAALCASVLLSGCNGNNSRATPAEQFPNVPTPTVTSLPIAAMSSEHNYPFMTVDFSLDHFGFVQEEFLMEGKANAYAMPVMNSGGTFAIELPVTPNPALASVDNAYRTRMFVIRPKDPAKFNGTVIYEWLNATNKFDIPVHWFQQKEMFLKRGYAYVGITVQDATISGTQGLKAWSPVRYGTLDVTNGGKVTGEQLSYDIFSQGAKAVRTDPRILPSLSVKKVIAIGASQSAGRLSMYLNSIHPATGNIFDGAILTVGGQQLRTDLAIPVIKILSEFEVSYTSPMTNEAGILQPDT
ncbi:MAG TPA: alpha/beta hydrolase domain-containing protein, partial [Pseudoduganella sp.]